MKKMVQDRTQNQHLCLSNCSRPPLSYVALPKSTATIWHLPFNCTLNYSEWNEQSERVVLFQCKSHFHGLSFQAPLQQKWLDPCVHRSKRLWIRVHQAELNFLLYFFFPCHFPSTFCVLIFIPICLALIWN